MNWHQLAEALDLKFPKEHLDRTAPVLDQMYADFNKAVDRDLSTVEPVGSFRPDGK